MTEQERLQAFQVALQHLENEYGVTVVAVARAEK